MRQFSLAFLFLFGILALVAQTPSIQKSPPLSPATPESVGMSSERLERISRIMNEAVVAGEIPGGVALVARKGKVVYQKAFGKSDVEGKRDFQTDDIFRIASQTKAITSTAVMMLWEEGHFRLDDPISKWIPEFKNPQVFTKFHYSDTTFSAVPADREITIRHLLTHTSGIGYGVIDADESFKLLYGKAGIEVVASMTPLTTAENVKRIASMPLHFSPGDKYQYSMGLDVLGYFIEIISGVSFDTFLETRLFKPLGMKDTYFHLPKEKADRLVSLLVPDQDEWTDQVPDGLADSNFPISGVTTLCSGGGGLSSTAMDYATFLQMYLNDGELNGTRILSRTTVDFMMDNQIGDLWGDRGSHYGLAFGVIDAIGEGQGGQGSIGTFSWGGAFNTSYFADPEEQVIGVILKQTRGQSNDKTSWQFDQLVGQAIDD